MPARPKRTAQRDATFFTALENAHSVQAACKAAGYKRQVAYRWRRSDPDFDARWREALAFAIDLLEEEADRRGRDGVDQPVFFRGAQCGVKRKYSDALLFARMKAVKPHLYREGAKAPPAEEKQNITVVVRDFSAEAVFAKLIAENKISDADLPPRIRAQLAKDGRLGPVIEGTATVDSGPSCDEA